MEVLTTKELKNKHSFRQAAQSGKDMARQWLVNETVPYLHVDKLREQLGSEIDGTTQDSSTGKESLKTSG